MTHRKIHWRKYILSFLITLTVFITAILLSNHFNSIKMERVRSIENTLATNILSLETQFDLFEAQSCQTIQDNPILSDEINSLAHRLDYMEANMGTDNSEVISLKKQYSLLEIKDLLLMQKIAKKCHTTPTFILYFYANDGTCNMCARQGRILTKIADEHPEVRIYAFDYKLDISALQTLIRLHKIENTLPALVINGKTYHGFMTRTELADILPEVSATSTATSSRKEE